MKIEEKLLDIIDYIDIKEEEFDNIDVNLTEIEKERIKRTVTKKARNKKSNKFKIATAASILILALFSGIIVYKPAFAENIPIFDAIYEKLGYYKDYKDYTQYIGQSKTVNGFTFTIDKLIGTPNKVVMAVKVHSKKELTKEDTNMFMMGININGVTWESGSSIGYLLDKNNLLMVLEEENVSKEFPKRGNLHINVNSTKEDKTSVKFDFNVDFSSSYEKTISRKFNGEKVNRISSSILGSFVFINNYNLEKDECLLKLDDKIYSSNEGGCNEDTGYSVFPLATYDEVKNAKDISVIPIKHNYGGNEEKLYEKYKKFLDKANTDFKTKVESQKILYSKNVTFSDGRKGEFYKVERDNNKVKVYFKSDKNSLFLLKNINLQEHFKNIEDAHLEQCYYGYIRKNPNEKNGYIIEFNNVNTNKELDLYFFTDGLILDKATIEKEIKLN